MRSPLASAVLERLPVGAARCVASAPGRLDVMGGIAEYTGALILNKPIAHHACVGVQPRTDGMVSITDLASADTCLELPLARLFGDGAGPRAADLADDLSDAGRASRCALGVLVETVRANVAPDFNSGVSIVVSSELAEFTDAGHGAAVAAATLIATARALDFTVEPEQAVRVCQRVENEWLDAAIGAGDAVCALLGEPQTIRQLRGEPYSLGRQVPLPDDLVLAGVDTGVLHPESKAKYEQARVASFMGRLLIDRIIRHEGGDFIEWDGSLSRISINDYVERFRDRIPTKLKGREFLDRFGETGDALTRIDPDVIYKVRSRTEHHIYEHTRSCQFVECLSRSIRNGDYGILAEAGELMYASHWSYGQRCGLGSVETDLLVNLIRRHGAEAGVYGAKISGRGCGGGVTVLLRASGEADAALEAALHEYHRRTGYEPKLARGSFPGSMVAGAQCH